MIGWLLAALLLAAPAQAQCIGFQCPAHQMVAKGYALDGQSTPTGAYSLRRLLTSYTTNRLVILRRTSDNALATIGFTATGAIDIAAASTHCSAGADPCFVTRWYDQASSPCDLVQATAGNQPAFIFAGLGIYPVVRYTTSTQALACGSNVTPATGVVSFSVVGDRVSGTGSFRFIAQNGANRFGPTSGSANSWALLGGTSGSVVRGVQAADNTWHTGLAILQGAGSSVYTDNTGPTVATATGNTTAGAPQIQSTAASTTVNIVEAMVFDNITLSAGFRATMNANQHAFWGF